MITFTGLVFSIRIVVLHLTSSQFSPSRRAARPPAPPGHVTAACRGEPRHRPRRPADDTGTGVSDFLTLAPAEIEQYGEDSEQVQTRIDQLLDDLAAAARPSPRTLDLLARIVPLIDAPPRLRLLGQQSTSRSCACVGGRRC
jgi:hypothetical protein